MISALVNRLLLSIPVCVTSSLIVCVPEKLAVEAMLVLCTVSSGWATSGNPADTTLTKEKNEVAPEVLSEPFALDALRLVCRTSSWNTRMARSGAAWAGRARVAVARRAVAARRSWRKGEDPLRDRRPLQAPVRTSKGNRRARRLHSAKTII